MIYTLLVIGHIIGTAIGVGGATFSDYIFFKSVKDGFIDKSELHLLKAASRLVVLGLAILLVTGFGFLAHYYMVPNSGAISEKLPAKLVVVLVVTINGWFLHRYVWPLVSEHAHSGLHVLDSVLQKKQTRVLTAGAISFVSWYAALIIGSWRNFPYSASHILWVYFGVLFVAILVANIGGRIVSRRARTLKKCCEGPDC